MDRVERLVVGFLLGAAVGAGMTLLFAPESGSDVRSRIQTQVDAIMEEGRRSAQQRREELLMQFRKLKESESSR